MMGWIENWPIKFLNRNFVRRRLPAKSNSVPFWLNSLIFHHPITSVRHPLLSYSAEHHPQQKSLQN